MVLIEPKKPMELVEEELKDLDISNEDFPEDLPELPEFKNEKEAKAYSKKLWANKTDERIKGLLKFKKNVEKSRREVEEEVLFRPNWISKIKSFLIGSQKVKVYILDSTGNIRRYSKKPKDQKIVIKKKTYIIKKNPILYFKGQPSLFYFENNPFPIHFNNDDHTILVNSEALYGMFQTNIVKQLFHQETAMRTYAITFSILFGIGLAGFMIISALKGDSNGIFLLLPITKRWLESLKI